MIGPAAPDDLVAVTELEVELFADEAWSAQAVLDLTAGPGRRLWVDRGEDGRVVGYALTGLAGDFAELLRLGVRRDAQRRGLARALLVSALDAARDDGAERMLLEVSAVNARALALYEAMGFEEIDRRPRYYRDGSDAMVLQRPLGPGSAGSGRMGA